MFRLLIQWLLSSIALMVVSKVVPGFYVDGLQPVLIAAVVIGLFNAALGFMLKTISFPIAVIMFTVFMLLVNCAMIVVTSKVVPGFYIYGWNPAIWASCVLTALGLIIRLVMRDDEA